MAYSVNGKIYTDHPLMDEIVDCCKTILKDIVIKNEALAISYETDESISESEEYINIYENKIKFANFPFTKEMLSNFTKNGIRVFDDDQVIEILNNRYVVPVELRDDLLVFCRKYYIDNYEERNNYYRMLSGLPPYKGTAYNIRRERSYVSNSRYDENDTGYYFFIYPTDFPSDFDTSTIDFTKPIHEQSPDVIAILQQTGVMDSFIEEYKGFNYSYLRYLGYKSVSVYKARKAIKFEILYMPTVEQLVQQRFEELYNINRNIYIRRTYQEAMSLGSNYFDESIILLMLCQTFNDMIVDVPEWYIRRDIFDIRSVQFFLESFGVQFFDVIPLKYQIAIVKNLNKLIKYKSSNRNNNDIIDIFDLKNTYVYKYFLYKKKLNESSSTSDDNYDLEFIKVKQGDAFDKYIEDNIYRYTYDDLTLSDKFWDGVSKEWKPLQGTTYKEKLHEDVRKQHIENADYTVEGTKYMSIDYEVGMSNYSYQAQYFFGYLLDSNLDSEDVKIVVPSINTYTEIPISHLFILLYLLSFSYDNVLDTIRRPEDTNTHTQTIITPRHEYYEQLYRDDGDYDDYYSWNNKFSKYNYPDYAFADNQQFNFGGVIRPTNLNDDEEFEFGDITYNLDYLTGEYDFEEMLIGEDTDYYDFNNPNFDDEDYNPYDEDDGIYNFYNAPPEEIPDPDIDNGYEFNGLIDTNPAEYYEENFFTPKHWEIKTYIENQDYDATEQGYNSFPVWLDDRDWAQVRVPETLKTSYNRVSAFNTTLEPLELDKIFEVLSRDNKVFNFREGYSGYGYEVVRDADDNILYYEITYNPTVSYEDYISYVDSNGTEESYNEWLDIYKSEYLNDDPRGPLGIGGFRIVKKLDNISDIMENFNINTECYNDIRNRIINSDSRDESIMLKYVYDCFFTREFDYNFYKVNGDNATYLSEILKNKNYMLYNFYNSIISENNINTRKDNIRSLMNDIITTLEYYLSGDNIEYIYSVFSITSFSSLLYYIYLMINFFKSWKVYFLDPAVTMNADDRLENTANNYGTGIDSIAEIKTNYWYEDKSFKRDGAAINTDYTHQDRTYERYKEVVDTYGHFDPDPQLDYDFDGFTAENDSDATRHNIIRDKDINGGVSNGKLNIPYNMVNGGKSYGKYLDIWDLDGSGPEEHSDYLRVDGGYALIEEELSIYPQDKSFNYMINGGEAGTNLFWTKTMHTKIIDRQIEQHALVSTKEGNLIKQGPDGLYLEQAWASWEEFNDVKRVSDIAMDYINYVMEVLYDDLLIITDEEALQIKINELINEDLSNMRKVVTYAKNIDSHERDYKNYIDNLTYDLREDFSNFSPYNWLEFVDNH